MGSASAKSDLPNGTSKRVHAEFLMQELRSKLDIADRLMTKSQMRRKPYREEAARVLAGVVGAAESLRVWLEKGAPE